MLQPFLLAKLHRARVTRVDGVVLIADGNRVGDVLQQSPTD